MKRNVCGTLVAICALAAPCVAQTYTVATVAGGANPYFLTGAGDGGSATSAALGIPAADVAVDNLGNLYIASGGLIREVTAKTGAISTIAGGGTSVGDGVPATQAALSPTAIAIDGSGNLYIADTAYGVYRIRKVAAGTITTVAGGAACCVLGDGGSALNAYLAVPYGVAVDGGGSVYIAQASGTTNSIRKVAANGTISTIAAGLSHPTGVAVDGQGNVYFADSGNNIVGEISNGSVTTVAGNGSTTNSGDGGKATQAGIHAPWHVALDGLGNMYISQLADGLVRWVAPGGTINTISDGGLLADPAGLTTSHGVVYVANEAAIPTAVTLTPEVPILSITKSHSGSFTQGQTGASYTITVTNSGAAASSGLVTVTDTLPVGLTLTAMGGTNWTCSLASASCTRSDGLGAGVSWPAINVTVTVSASAAASVTNQAAVSGGGSAGANASDVTTINSSAVNTFFSNEVSVGSGLYYMAFPDGNLFGYFGFLQGSASTANAWLYHVDLGYEYVTGAGANGSLYFYDLTSGHWWFSSSSLFPYLYDFTLNAWIYYFPNTGNPGHYTANPRYFSNLTTGQIFEM